ncbi:MAG: response regulator [Planctomycetes bacterium]|nr:response regulator [Planctomycetota bacterium]
MTDRPRLLVLGAGNEADRSLLELIQSLECTVCTATDDGWPTDETDSDQDYSGAVVLGAPARRLPALLAFENVLKHLPEGVAVLDSSLQIRWCNNRFFELTGRTEPDSVSPVGLSFHDAFGSPQIVGPDFSPFHTALGAGSPARTTYRVGDKTYFDVLAAPVYADNAEYPSLLVVTVRDISAEQQQVEKLKAIHQAGEDLGDLAPEDLASMKMDDRKELLKQKIVQHTKNVLNFETIEVRLLNERTNRLEPLLNVGMTAEAAARELIAEPQGNGVTGFVAATGKSYLCRDTSTDLLYLRGAVGACSSLTVPLMHHDRVLGTFNVESTKSNAFSEQDQQFLELFCRDLAVALNTLELLVFERVTSVSESSTQLLRDAAKPVDEILNDIAWLQTKYVGFDPEAAGRLQRMLKQTRTIRQLIHGVGEKAVPKTASPVFHQAPSRPKLKQKRVLVADGDESVRQAAHELLARYGCDVETAHNGEEALLMIRSFHYDVVLFDAEMTDMHLIEALTQILDIHPHLPVILMKGFGYDGAHRMVKARQMGFKLALYKPFRLDLLLAELEKALAPPDEFNAK